MEQRDLARALLAHVYRSGSSTKWGWVKGRRYEAACGSVKPHEHKLTFAASKRPPQGSVLRRKRKRYFWIFCDGLGIPYIEFRATRLNNARCLGIARLLESTLEQSITEIEQRFRDDSNADVELDIDHNPQDEKRLATYLKERAFDRDGNGIDGYETFDDVSAVSDYVPFQPAVGDDDSEDEDDADEEVFTDVRKLTLFNLKADDNVQWAKAIS